jgi:hypothetical protein
MHVGHTDSFPSVFAFDLPLGLCVFCLPALSSGPSTELCIKNVLHLRVGRGEVGGDSGEADADARSGPILRKIAVLLRGCIESATVMPPTQKNTSGTAAFQ